MNVFKSQDYREIIGEKLSAKKFLDKSYTFQNMAKFMRIQKPYLSKVMNHYADFNSDQMFMACEFLEFTPVERDYLLQLLELERSIYPERRDVLLKKIESIQDEHRDAKKALIQKNQQMNAQDFDHSIHVEYYLDPYIQLTHSFLVIEKFRKEPKLIMQALQLSENEYQEKLIKLEEMNIIEIVDDQIEILIRNKHLPRESKIVPAHQQLISQLGLQRKLRLSPIEKKSFSATFSSNEKARKKIEEEFNEFLKKVQKISMEGKKTDCYQLNFDLFPWSNPKAK